MKNYNCKFKIILFLILLIFFGNSIEARINDPKTTVSNTNEGRNTKKFDLTKVLPEGFKVDGSVDYTSYIQKGIDENKNVIMPNFPILINEKGIYPKSNSTIHFNKKSVIIMKPNSLENYAIIMISNVHNVILESPVIIGERNQHKGSKGEWGMGIQITASKNIRINSPKISNCWGDGIYIGGDEANTCENIKILNTKIDSCRRNGISITDGKNIQIISPLISNTQGTSPMSGIDIEPNNKDATIENITISNPTTLNNKQAGIAIVLIALPSEKSKNVSIKIANHIDKQSNIALWLVGARTDDPKKLELSGSILISNPKWYDNKHTIISEKFDLGPKTIFTNIKIFNNEMRLSDNSQNQEISNLMKDQSGNKKIVIEN